MKSATLKALLVIAALTVAPAAAIDPGAPGDLALDMRLSVVTGHLPVFVLEAETVMGYELDGTLHWVVNGAPVESEPILTIGGAYIDIQVLPVAEAAIVCARAAGRLELGGDLGRDVVEQDCVLWLPSDQPIRPVLGQRDLLESLKYRAPVLAGDRR